MPSAGVYPQMISGGHYYRNRQDEYFLIIPGHQAISLSLACKVRSSELVSSSRFHR